MPLAQRRFQGNSSGIIHILWVLVALVITLSPRKLSAQLPAPPELNIAIELDGHDSLISSSGQIELESILTHDGFDSLRLTSSESAPVWFETKYTNSTPTRIRFNGYGFMDGGPFRRYTEFQLTDNGNLLLAGLVGPQWQSYERVLTPGIHHLRWSVVPGNGYNSFTMVAFPGTEVYLDELSFEDLPSIPLPEATGRTDWAWSTSSSFPWFGTLEPSSGGLPAASSPSIGEGQVTWLEATVTFPKRSLVTFQSKIDRTFTLPVAGLGPDVRFGVYVDGTLARKMMPEPNVFDERVNQYFQRGWRTHHIYVPSGTHTIRWAWNSFPPISNGPGVVMIQEVTSKPADELTFGDVLGLPDHNIVSEGSHPWSIDTSDPEGDNATIQVSQVGDDGWLEFAVTNATPSSLYLSGQSSIQPGDQFIFELNGTPIVPLSSQQILPQGKCTLRWRLSRSIPSPFVSTVRLYVTSIEAHEVPTHLGPGLPVTFGGDQPWFIAPNRGDGFFCPPILSGQTSWMETKIISTQLSEIKFSVSRSEVSIQLNDGIVQQRHGQEINGFVDRFDRAVGILTPGTNIVRWTVSNTNLPSLATPPPTAAILAPSLRTLVDHGLGNVAGIPELSWDSGGDSKWYGWSNVFYSQDLELSGPVLASGPLPPGGKNWIEARGVFSNSMTLSFWSARLDDPSAKFRLRINGALTQTIDSPHGERTRRDISLPAGSVTIRWEYSTEVPSGPPWTVNVANWDHLVLSRHMWLWGFNLVRTAPTSSAIAAALDDPHHEYFVSDPTWTPQREVNHDGIDSLCVLPTTENPQHDLYTYINGPGTLTFWWKWIGAGDGAFAEVYVGNSLGRRIDSATDWSQVILEITSGQAFVGWRFNTGSGEISVNSPKLYLDSVNFLPSTDQFPISVPDTILVEGGHTTTFPISRFLDNDWDPNGDPVVLHSVGLSSFNGGEIKLVGDLLSYTPTSEFVGVDYFDYNLKTHISDEFYVSGTVKLEVLPSSDSEKKLLSITPIDAEHVRMVILGLPNFGYQLQSSLDMASWDNLATITTAPNGQAEYIDTVPSGAPTRFYRLANQ